MQTKAYSTVDVNYPLKDLCVKGLVPRLALLGDAVVF